MDPFYSMGCLSAEKDVKKHTQEGKYRVQMLNLHDTVISAFYLAKILN